MPTDQVLISRAVTVCHGLFPIRPRSGLAAPGLLWRATAVTFALLLVCADVRAQGQLPDNDRGFPVNATFATSGIDNVNLFNQSLVLSLPIGPEYPTGAGFTHQLRLAYNSLIWHPALACQTNDPFAGPQDHNGVYVSGSPLLGAGWALNLGSLHSRPNSDIPGSLFYVSPEGATHRFVEGRTKDGSFLRVRNTVFSGNVIQSAEVDFPDGSVGVFDQVATPSTIQHGPTYRDFVSDASYLRELRSPFGDKIVVNYETTGGVHRIQSIEHRGQGSVLLRTLTFSYATLVVNTAPSGGSTSATWTVLQSITLPAAHSTSQTVTFSYHANGFDRPATDAIGGAAISRIARLADGAKAGISPQVLQLQRRIEGLRRSFEDPGC